jgi:hypothetical protein
MRETWAGSNGYKPMRCFWNVQKKGTTKYLKESLSPHTWFLLESCLYWCLSHTRFLQKSCVLVPMLHQLSHMNISFSLVRKMSSHMIVCYGISFHPYSTIIKTKNMTSLHRMTHYIKCTTSFKLGHQQLCWRHPRCVMSLECGPVLVHASGMWAITHRKALTQNSEGKKENTSLSIASLQVPKPLGFPAADRRRAPAVASLPLALLTVYLLSPEISRH